MTQRQGDGLNASLVHERGARVVASGMHTDEKVGSECGGSKCDVTAQIKQDEGGRNATGTAGAILVRKQRKQKREEVVSARNILSVWSERA